MFVFDPKTLKPFLNDAKPPELCPKYCFFTQSVKSLWIYLQKTRRRAIYMQVCLKNLLRKRELKIVMSQHSSYLNWLLRLYFFRRESIHLNIKCPMSTNDTWLPAQTFVFLGISSVWGNKVPGHDIWQIFYTREGVKRTFLVHCIEGFFISQLQQSMTLFEICCKHLSRN